MPFGYINENNPVSIGDYEAQSMINARIDRGYLEYCDYAVDESVPVPNRVVHLPNGREIKICPPSGQDWISDGFVRWKKSGEENYYSPAVEITPDMIAHGFNSWILTTAVAPTTIEVYLPQMAGEYFYCATITDNRTGVESSPYYFPSVNVTEEEAKQEETKVGIRFQMVHVQGLDDNYTIKVYRMPIGGNVWMFIFDHSGYIVDDSIGETKFDPKPDEYLTESDMCETVSQTSIPFTTNRARSISLFDDKLWIGMADTDESQQKDFGILYYSNTGKYAEFPATHFFTFPDPVVGITPYDQQLIVQTAKQIYYIYGDPDNYSMKLIDFKFNGIVRNSGQALGSYAYFLAVDDLLKPNYSRGLFMFNGSTVGEISQKINKQFPAYTTYRNWVLDNRFFIFELKNKDDNYIKVVYDTIGNGFCLVNGEQKFYYRTKEYSTLPNGRSFMKKICVRAKGTFILYVVADGHKVITKHRRTSDKPVDHYLYVKPNRATSFSFVFEGHEGSEIYDWRVAE